MYDKNNFINYDYLIQNSLLDVVRSSLKFVEKNGLLGSHHFYITFKTKHINVIIPNYLKKIHPDNITIVIQHQFWNLNVFQDKFTICLSFNDIQENLEIPFCSLISFTDPAAKFSLQFTQNIYKCTNNHIKTKKEKKTTPKSNILNLDKFRKNK